MDDKETASECAPVTGSGNGPDSVTLFLLKRRKLELLRQKVAAIKQFGLKYYRPHPGQSAFHLAGATTRRRMVRTGNRWGKSTAGVAEDLSWALRCRPWLDESDPNYRAGLPQHPTRGLVITTDWETVDDVFTGDRGTKGKFWKMVRQEDIKTALRNHSGSIDTLEFTNGSLIKFNTVKAYMTNPQAAESKDWDWIHVDEPCPEGMFKACARGLMDRRGSVWFTLTPLREPWINDFFFPQETGGVPRDDVWTLNGSTVDNPYLSPEAIAEFEATLTEEEKLCRLHGLPLHLAGLVYKEFQWDRHVLKKLPEGWSSFLEPPGHYTYYVFIDPHPQTPHAVLFCAVSPFGQRFYYTDLFFRGSIANLCVKIKETLRGRSPIVTRIDPLAYVNNPITETNMATEFAENGIYVEKATKALEHGIIHARGELEKKDTIYFTPECRRTLWEIQRYCWDVKENRPMDRDDHMMENFYRCELEPPVYIDPTPRENRCSDIAITKPEFELEDYSLAGV